MPLGALLAAACGFPDVAFTPGDGGDGGDDASSSGDVATGHDAAGEGSSGTEGGGDDGTTEAAEDAAGDATADGTSDAATDAGGDSAADAVADVGPDVVEAGSDASVCDQDQDGYRSTASGCNGNDCCDNDKQAHPGVTAFFTTADHCGSFDYNCDGTMEGQYKVNLACSGTPALGCQGGSGFTADPGCGNLGPFGTCQANGALTCAPGSLITASQGCR